jgi:hypothetical protein
MGVPSPGLPVAPAGARLVERRGPLWQTLGLTHPGYALPPLRGWGRRRLTATVTLRLSVPVCNAKARPYRRVPVSVPGRHVLGLPKIVVFNDVSAI